MKIIILILIVNLILLKHLFGIGPYKLILKLFKNNSSIKNGEDLYLNVSSIIPGSVHFGTIKENLFNIEYKYFNEIFKNLFEINRKFGAEIQRPWSDLRKSLLKDIAFEKKLKGVTSQAIGQMSVMSFFLIIFACSFTYILETNLPSYVWGVLFTLLSLAWFSYFIILRRIKTNQWRNASQVIRTLIMIDSLSISGLSSIEILKKSNVGKIEKINDKDFSILKIQFLDATNAWQKTGRPIKSILNELINEFWYVMEQKLEVLSKRVQALQLICTFVFILPAFFFLVSSTFLSFSGFLIE